jgi:predicted Ser/Thr protein kinase
LGRETPPRIVAAGQSFDEMERVSGKWLIKTRDVAAKN